MGSLKRELIRGTISSKSSDHRHRVRRGLDFCLLMPIDDQALAYLPAPGSKLDGTSISVREGVINGSRNKMWRDIIGGMVTFMRSHLPTVNQWVQTRVKARNFVDLGCVTGGWKTKPRVNIYSLSTNLRGNWYYYPAWHSRFQEYWIVCWAEYLRKQKGKQLWKKKETKDREKMTSEVEELAVQLESGMELSRMECGVKLIAKVLVDQQHNKWGVKNILQSAWKEFGEIQINWVQDNLYVVLVRDEDVTTRILELVPWAVMKQNPYVKRWAEDLVMEEIPMHLVPF